MQKLFASFVVLLTITYGKKKANQDLMKYITASTEDHARVFEMEKIVVENSERISKEKRYRER